MGAFGTFAKNNGQNCDKCLRFTSSKGGGLPFNMPFDWKMPDDLPDLLGLLDDMGEFVQWLELTGLGSLDNDTAIALLGEINQQIGQHFINYVGQGLSQPPDGICYSLQLNNIEVSIQTTCEEPIIDLTFTSSIQTYSCDQNPF